MDKDKTPYPLKARERIQVGKILAKLERHIDGEVEMTPTQINAARILINKCLPDLKAIEHSGETTQTHSVDPQSSEQVARRVIELINAARA